MKKKLIGIICLSLLFVMTGCNKETNQDNTVIQDNTNDNKEVIVDDVSVNDETNDIINNNQSESVENESDNINNDNRKSEENIIDNTTNNEDYNDSEQVIETPIESKKEDTPSCIEKKFSNTYSYVYSTKEECKLNGSSVFDDVYENKDDTIFSYGCDTIIDDCGNTWYGIYFLRYSENGNIKLYY